MPVREIAASPVVVGRDELLALAIRRIDEAAAGRGELLLVAGEAGIGKTRLLASISRHAEQSSFAVVRAAAFRGDAEASGGLLLDLAGDLRRTENERSRAAGAAISQRLREPVSDASDPHRHRRLLVQDLVDAFSELDSGRRLLVVLEDLHWADDLSLEVFGHVAGRLANRSVLVVGAYRSDELYPRSAIREWRRRLVSQRLAEEVHLRRLTLEQTATLTSSILGRAAPAQLVAAIYDRSDGIPLHIEELLGAVEDSALDLADVRVPDTLADAVLVRAALLDRPTRDVAAAAAVIGRRFDFDLLTAVTGAPGDEVARCLRELQAAYLVTSRAVANMFDFRHALIRDALYADISLPRRRELHHRVAGEAAARGYGDAFVSTHFDEAGCTDDAYRHARRAAEGATSVSAHREALELYRRALRNLPAVATPDEHARLLAALGHACAAVDDNEAAAQAYATAHDLWTAAGDRVAAAAIVPPLVAVRHLLGDDLESRTRRLEGALESLGSSPDVEVQAQLLSALAAAHMLSRRLDEAIEYGDRSCVSCEEINDEPTAINTAATMGSVLLFAGRMDDGWQRLEQAIARAMAIGHELEAARSYRMLGTSASVLVEYDVAEKWLGQGISYAEKVELWNHRSYMAAHLAHVQWATGDWVAAAATAEHALADGRGGITTRITAQYVLGYLAMGRADWGKATELLTAALDEGESMNELQRLSPPLWGLAEIAVMCERYETAIALCERAFTASDEVCDAAYLFPFLVTGARARLALGDRDGAAQWVKRVSEVLERRAIPGTLPAISHANALLHFANGDIATASEGFAAARVAWEERNRLWEASWAALDEAKCLIALRRTAEGRSIAEAVKSRALAVDSAALVKAAGHLIDGDAAPAQPWHPLTAREYAVANLIASGLTNRQIAAELVLSPKTVSAHVEHILAKLDAARRAEIAAWAARVSRDEVNGAALPTSNPRS
ncbi:MAG: helix-turn-helix transcriptional regulator [Acidothermaceae bacterium]